MEDTLPGIDELMTTIRGINDGTITEETLDEEVNEDVSEEVEVEETLESEAETETEDEDEVEVEDEAEVEVEEEEEEPQEQTKEERRRYAAERREREMQEKVEREVQNRLKESPEIQLANQLAEMYNLPVDQMLAQIQESRMQQEAEKQNVPIEVIRQQEALKAENKETQKQLAQMQYKLWDSRTEREGQELMKQYSLTPDEIKEAKTYMLETLRNPEVPLRTAVMALHGDKILNSISEQAQNDALAKVSGRKKSALPPQGGKPPSTESLTDEERYMAQQFGMTEEEWLKNK